MQSPKPALAGSSSADDLLEPWEARRLVHAEHGSALCLQQLTEEWRLFCVLCAGQELYPALQWYDGRIVPGLPAVLGVLAPHRAAWKILSWFLTGNDSIGGARPADVLPLHPRAVLGASQMEVLARPGLPGALPMHSWRAPPGQAPATVIP